MEMLTALENRKSIRAFRPDPVPREVLLKVLNAARWTPSWGNTQPWEVAVACGPVLKGLTDEMVSAFDGKTPPTPDVPMPATPTFPEVHQNRYMACAAGLFGTMGIPREDKARRWGHMLQMTRAYGAPCILYVMFDANLEVPYTMFDLGAFTHGLCLAAWDQGLGTCIEAQLAIYPEIVRRHLRLSRDRKIAVGIALGYPDLEAPANAFRTEREPMDKFVLRLED